MSAYTRTETHAIPIPSISVSITYEDATAYTRTETHEIPSPLISKGIVWENAIWDPVLISEAIPIPTISMTFTGGNPLTPIIENNQAIPIPTISMAISDFSVGIVTAQQVSLLLTQHRIAREKQQIKDYNFGCLTASGGTIDFDTPIVNKVSRVVIKPDTGATQPDNLFDVVINDVDGNDILGGWGQDCPNSVNTDLLPDKISDPKVNGQLNILVSNAGNAKGLNIRIYYTW
jgi:hypothetical protein